MGNIPKKHETYGVFTRGQARECSVLGAMKGFSRLARVEVISQHHLALKASSVRLPKRAMTCCGETLCVHRKCLKMRSARGLHHSQFVTGHRTAGGGTSEFVSGRETSRKVLSEYTETSRLMRPKPWLMLNLARLSLLVASSHAFVT